MVSAKFIFSLAAFAAAATAAPVDSQPEAHLEKRSYSGRATYYQAGMGNCGWENTGADKIVALNTAQYGSTSDQSEHCGKKVRIHHNGQTQTATVADSCPTCNYGSLDMSKSLFGALTNDNFDLGEFQMTWEFV
ncbi:hypothetical protein FA10DRAFT_266634 [Acaromyces ingoldii]|uniref:Barwin-like endoglucanase n=1 Tax=Acaromyces ingoldii TaxID=215250 RepID=A0A316YQU0_9BASI|nr:hypothetical protein FA10DRAFT_266634 [Acaromyces ingoldii]PWN90135.1 hypothetical protein FA10DRAFT_266634 [Acaromyces ingoldii]